MRLADFIASEMGPILTEWDEFASTQMPAARSMTKLLLRDHAPQILEAVVKDLSASQTPAAQVAKSQGHAPKTRDAPATAAETHGLLRAESGFELRQMASEYRALRATVLRLWMDAYAQPHVEEVMRFNEAIDQALAESIGFFSDKLEESRSLFLGMLGHDLRTPLQAILLTAEYLEQLKAGTSVSEAAARLIRGALRMQALLADLVEFNRTKLGMGLLVFPAKVDAAQLFGEEVEQIRTAYPDRLLELQVTGSTIGTWDGVCLQRMLDNLVVNAIKYGDPNTPVQILVAGDAENLSFDVKNTGPRIEPSMLAQLFEPLRRGAQPAQTGERRSLGLGLYIAREIAKAHGGEIKARSEKSETVFSVRLPKTARPQARQR